MPLTFEDIQEFLTPVKEMKLFLEMVQPLPVKYGYIRGVTQEGSVITYRNMSASPRLGVGNRVISERINFVVTVQTKTAEQNLIYSTMIKWSTSQSKVIFVSEDLRRDVTVENGWINTIILSTLNSMRHKPLSFSSEEAREMLQAIADNYVMITSLYKEPFDESIIDKFIVPELEDRRYYYLEVVEMKQEYFDRYILTITEY